MHSQDKQFHHGVKRALSPRIRQARHFRQRFRRALRNFDEGDECLLTDIYKKSGISKQTVNSALRTLEKDGIVYLEKIDGRTKKVVLTEKGKMFVKNTVARLYQAEARAFDDWTDEEIRDYLERSEKYIRRFVEEIDKL